MQTVKLEVSFEQLKIINAGLLQMPYGTVADLIEILKAQVRQQVQPTPVPAPEAKDAA